MLKIELGMIPGLEWRPTSPTADALLEQRLELPTSWT
jgi:hypothetical protein